MGTNDVIALEANFKSWQENRFPTPKKDINLFEYYSIGQFLRPLDLSDSQQKTGMIGGGKDGGVDGFYMFINGELVDAETEPDPKTVENVRILIMQVKESEGFSPVAVDKLFWFSDDLLDLTRKKTDYHSTYRPELISLMRLVKDKYGVIIGEDPPISVEFYYITKKDVEPNEDCRKSAEKIKANVKKYFNKAQCEFHFVNAAGLWMQVQTRPSKKKILKWESQPLSTQEGTIGLVKLTDYYEFLKESDDKISERIFDSNVRGYWKNTDINKQIAATLNNPSTSEFWLLNNGITILAEKIENAEGFLEIEITDPQIVNGLQTSRQIYSYYREGKNLPSSDLRRVLVRIIKTQDKQLRDDVIRSTNSQNEMPQEALRTTDPIHRQIETLFHTYNLFYDRRKGHYRDQGKPVTSIVSVVEVLQAMLAVVLRRPDDARARPRNYFKSNELYESVFGKDKYDLTLYLRSTELLRCIDTFVDEMDLELIHRRNLDFYLCTYATCAAVGNAYATPVEILKIDVPSLSQDFLKDCYQRVWKHYQALATKHMVDGERDYDSLAKGPLFLKAISTDLKRRFTKKR